MSLELRLYIFVWLNLMLLENFYNSTHAQTPSYGICVRAASFISSGHLTPTTWFVHTYKMRST